MKVPISADVTAATGTPSASATPTTDAVDPRAEGGRGQSGSEQGHACQTGQAGQRRGHRADERIDRRKDRHAHRADRCEQHRREQRATPGQANGGQPAAGRIGTPGWASRVHGRSLAVDAGPLGWPT